MPATKRMVCAGPNTHVRGDATPTAHHPAGRPRTSFSPTSIRPSLRGRSGPFNAIWLNVNGMRSEANGALRAPYRNHQWDVDGLSYFRLDCTARVTVHFERARERSTRYGRMHAFRR